MRRRSSHLNIVCVLLVLGLLGPFAFAATIANVVSPETAASITVGANVYFALPVLAVWGICRLVRVWRPVPQGASYSPFPPYPHYPPYPPYPSYPPPHQAPSTPSTPATPRATSTPRTPKRTAKPDKPIYWGKQLIGHEDANGVIHIDRIDRRHP
jgi:hypothetical protein